MDSKTPHADNSNGIPLPPEAMEAFTAAFGGEIIGPHDASYESARRVWNGMIDRRPALIARCTGVADVTAAVDFARHNSLPVAVRGGGHSISGHGVCDDGLVMDLSPMKGVWVDPARRTALVQAGVTWGELDRETQKFGLAVTGGRVSSTGVSGLTLGSGSGWLERKYGLTCDSLLSADVVTADGRFLRASADENPDLFWAIKGGGGNFGVVTSFEFRLHPVGPIVLGGMMLYEADKAAEVFRFYRDMMAEAPDDLGGGLGFLTAPPAPFIPAGLQGQRAVAIIVLYTGPIEEGEEALAPLREFAAPDADLVGPMPYTALQRMIDEGNPPGLQGYFKAEFLSELPDEAIDAAIERAEHISSELSVVLFQPMGGEFARNGSDTALSHRGAPWCFHVLSLWHDPALAEAHVAWTRSFSEAMRPYTTDGVYLNFIGDEGEERVRASYGPSYERLSALKEEYDPENFFRLNQNIKPAVEPTA